MSVGELLKHRQSQRIGAVHAGSTLIDHDPQECRRGITIDSVAITSLLHCAQINLFGRRHLDCNIEVKDSLRRRVR
jgi:elongation factor G